MTKMKNDYTHWNYLERILWPLSAIIAVIGFYFSLDIFLGISSFLFFILGMVIFLKYLLFKKAEVGYSTGVSGLSALIWTIIVGLIVIGIAIALFTRII